MNRKFWKNLLILLVAFAFISSCKKDDDNTPPNTTPPVEDIINGYSGSATPGDLITFDINQTDFTYAIHNETEGDSYGGNYTILTGNLYGIYNLKANFDNFYAVEMTDKVIAANFRSTLGNAITFGVSSEIDNTSNLSNIAGDYIYIAFSDATINGSINNKEWGVITANSDGSLFVKNYATGGTGTLPALAPENFALPLPLTTGDITGSWSVNGSHKERLNVTLSNAPGTTFTGYSYATTDGACFILDRGAGNGYLLGLRIMDYTPAQLAGIYSFAGIVTNGNVLADKVTVNADGTGSAFTINQDGAISYEELDSLNQCTVFPNVVYGDHLTGTPLQVTGKIYTVMVNEMTMYFIFDNSGNFNAYGAGAKK